MTGVTYRDDVFDWRCDEEQAERVRQAILARQPDIHAARVEHRPYWFWAPQGKTQ